MDQAELRSLLRDQLQRDADGMREQFGAHALGIGSDADGRPTLRVYVDFGRARTVPGTFSFVPSGREEPVVVPVEFVETPPATFE